MRIGILSDSHGRADNTALAVKSLRDRGAELLLHLGDLGSRDVIDELAGGPARIVFGNCDPDSTAGHPIARSVLRMTGVQTSLLTSKSAALLSIVSRIVPLLTGLPVIGSKVLEQFSGLNVPFPPWLEKD